MELTPQTTTSDVAADALRKYEARVNPALNPAHNPAPAPVPASTPAPAPAVVVTPVVPPAAPANASPDLVRPVEDLVANAARAFAPQLVPVEAPAAPVAAADPMDTVVTPDAHAFAQLRADRKTLKAQLTEREQALAAKDAELKRIGEERAKFAESIAAREKEVTELQEQIGKVNLEAAPQFREKFDGRLALIKTKLTSGLTSFGKSSPEEAAALADRLMNASPTEIAESLEKASPLVAGLVMNAWQDAQTVQAERTAAVSEWRKTSATLKLTEVQSNTQESVRQRQSLAEKALAEASADCFVYRDVGTPESKQSAEQYRQAFQGFVQGASQEDLVRKAADGFAAPTLYRILQLQADRIRQLEAATSAGNNAGRIPIGTPSNTQAAAAPTKAVPEGMNVMEAAESAAARAVRVIQSSMFQR